MPLIETVDGTAARITPRLTRRCPDTRWTTREGSRDPLTDQRSVAAPMLDSPKLAGEAHLSHMPERNVKGSVFGPHELVHQPRVLLHELVEGFGLHRRQLLSREAAAGSGAGNRRHGLPCGPGTCCRRRGR